ncbi:hypothetical protein F5B19DRAFT_438020 [Rostrohypoxylon terebratum]|nr:hypothetical protein F5B19DRAFT_438020 [Rostrohypoxylon terebratum]
MAFVAWYVVSTCTSTSFSGLKFPVMNLIKKVTCHSTSSKIYGKSFWNIVDLMMENTHVIMNELNCWSCSYQSGVIKSIGRQLGRYVAEMG